MKLNYFFTIKIVQAVVELQQRASLSARAVPEFPPHAPHALCEFPRPLAAPFGVVL